MLILLIDNATISARIRAYLKEKTDVCKRDATSIVASP